MFVVTNSLLIDVWNNHVQISFEAAVFEREADF